LTFRSATQTWEIEIINNASNFFDAILVFLSDAKKFGLDERLILDCFGKPDDWESIYGIGTMKAPSLFPYILTA